MDRRLVVTGYKSHEMGIFQEEDRRVLFIKEAIRRRLIAFLEEGGEWVLVSCQPGVEFWTAQVVLELKEDYDVSLAVLPPFEGAEERWPEDIQMAFQEIKEDADFYKPVYKGGYQGAFQFKAKDRFLIEHSDRALVLYDEETPGTPKFFLEMARFAEGYEIERITPEDLQDTVEELEWTSPELFEGGNPD
ncbi:hypothetical protein MJ3_01707 [Salimicrobium jeotgali]|uniref:Uncharacterized protein n=2 Tax=Salimicrobium jeotgali TaxID=1230341 RepID=K2GCA7_9BACI|nr:DUF1273 domain-containing protein [Salimicrobium jeotgali]EKE32633.1 hypothetical protein MJ3_01707 [Salimicrobium jeotgali]MBM7695384.1 putative phage-like protein YoqJ [Salimicrobium jeotgali]